MSVSSSPQDRPMGLAMTVLMASQLVYLYLHLGVMRWISIAVLLAIPVLGWRSMRVREYYLLAVCGALLALVMMLDAHPAEIVSTGLERASYLAAFILLMGLLRDAAVTSPSILACGRYMTRQPPQRRYVAVFGGSHLFSVMINLGSMSLLAPIIQRGVRGDDKAFADLDLIDKVRERRQLTAALRGFSWILVWAPTAVTQAILPTLIPGIDPLKLLLLGLMITVIMLVAGGLEDAITWLPLRRRLSAEGALPRFEKTAPPWRAIGRLAVICVGLFGLTFGFLHIADVTVVTGAMLAAPIVVLFWFYRQQSDRPTGPGGYGERLRQSAFQSMPGFVRETVFIGCAGFIGTSAAALVPAERIATMLNLGDAPGWGVMACLSIFVLFAGQIGLSPITMSVFLGSVYAEFPVSPVEPTLAALAIAAGTAIASMGGPFSSSVAMLARVSGHDSVTLTWRWNGVFTLLALAILVIIYMILSP